MHSIHHIPAARLLSGSCCRIQSIVELQHISKYRDVMMQCVQCPSAACCLLMWQQSTLMTCVSPDMLCQRNLHVEASLHIAFVTSLVRNNCIKTAFVAIQSTAFISCRRPSDSFELGSKTTSSSLYSCALHQGMQSLSLLSRGLYNGECASACLTRTLKIRLTSTKLRNQTPGCCFLRPTTTAAKLVKTCLPFILASPAA